MKEGRNYRTIALFFLAGAVIGPLSAYAGVIPRGGTPFDNVITPIINEADTITPASNTQALEGSAGKYIPIVPIPGLNAGGSLADLINVLFKFAIIGGGILAVIFITIGGLEYMISGAREGKKGGKERIQSAIIGLLLLLLSYLILFVINPDILKLDPFRTKLPPSPGVSRPSGSSGGVSPEVRQSVAASHPVLSLRQRPECRDVVDRAIARAAKVSCTTTSGNDCTDYSRLSIIPQSSFVTVEGENQNYGGSDSAGQQVKENVRYDSVAAELNANPTPGCEL